MPFYRFSACHHWMWACRLYPIVFFQQWVLPSPFSSTKLSNNWSWCLFFKLEFSVIYWKRLSQTVLLQRICYFVLCKNAWEFPYMVGSQCSRNMNFFFVDQVKKWESKPIEIYISFVKNAIQKVNYIYKSGSYTIIQQLAKMEKVY